MREVTVVVRCDMCRMVYEDLVEHSVTLVDGDRTLVGTADMCPSCWQGVVDYVRQFTMLDAKAAKKTYKSSGQKAQCDICGGMYAAMGLSTHKNKSHGIVAASTLAKMGEQQ